MKLFKVVLGKPGCESGTDMMTALFNDESLSRFLTSRWAHYLARVATLGLVLLVAHSLATFTWLMVPAQQQDDLPVRIDAPQVTRTRVEGQGGQPIAALHLFGKAKRNVNKPTAAPVEAPKTKLNLALKGLIASDDKAAARAIIAQPNGQEEQYAVDALLPGDVQLSDILADRVILLRNSRYETLLLPKESDKESDKSVSSPAFDLPHSPRRPPNHASR